MFFLGFSAQFVPYLLIISAAFIYSINDKWDSRVLADDTCQKHQQEIITNDSNQLSQDNSKSFISSFAHIEENKSTFCCSNYLLFSFPTSNEYSFPLIIKKHYLRAPPVK